ncbi:Trehalose transport system permease protein SugA [Propionicimonas sp. T2.31MG-18]|uniref:carbohydrate ABC transporter permease n=1 Tax=Propionicimonas sp. T2.31MG-18 TaxID=3157620 RepID=UPI0035EA9272
MARRRFASLLMLPAIIFLIATVAYPLGTLIFNAFFSVKLLTPNRRTWVGLDNFVNTLTSPEVGSAALRTLQYSVFAMTLELLLGFGAALLFYAMRERSGWARTVFIFPLLVPPIVAGLLWKFLLSLDTGMVNRVLELVGLTPASGPINWLGNTDTVIFTVAFADIWLTTSFVALIAYAGLQGLPGDVLEAAQVDGAGYWQRVWHVILPLLRPVIAVIVIIRGVDVAKTFDLIFIQTEGGPQGASEVLSLEIYRTMIRYGNVGSASATAAVFLLVMAFFAAMAYRVIWKPANDS